MSSLTSEDPFASKSVARSLADIIGELANRAHEIRRYAAPRPYWPQRRGREAPGPHLDSKGARKNFARLVYELESHGYLGQTFPDPCIDSDEASCPSPAAELEKRLGIPNLWPLNPAEWDDDIFYGLIEVFHDLVSRPRARYHHDYRNCGWHNSSFATVTGREIFRWRVNDLLTAAGIDYRLADSGEDQGRLVEIFDDGRTTLISEAMQHSQPDLAGRVRHAIALFRSRTSSAEDKRSATVMLAGILEERRQLIKSELVSRDEGALFQIANQFALRHRNADQREDYDPAFLDWVFWWYLGTVELTNRIIARQASPR
jgi:hypothetical protein